jgi:hypothetical protein
MKKNFQNLHAFLIFAQAAGERCEALAELATYCKIFFILS